MKSVINRRQFLVGGMVASAGLSPLVSALAAGTNAAENAAARPQVSPNSRGTLLTGKIGEVTLSRLISGGNLFSGWCHQRDLLFVRNIAAAYLTEREQHDTLQMLEELGVNAVVIDLMQQDIVNKYLKERGGKMQSIVSVREDWGDWSTPHLDSLMTQTLKTIDKGADLVYLHGAYTDQVVKAALEQGRTQNLDLLGKVLDLIRAQGFSAGLGAHAQEVLQEGKRHGLNPDFYVKTFHHDRYWSATPKERRKPFCVDGPLSLDHDEFHDNIFCTDAEATAEFMLGETVPWIAFKVLAAGAIKPESGFKFAFENGADFIAVGMFDFEASEDVQTLRETLNGLQRKRPWSIST